MPIANSWVEDSGQGFLGLGSEGKTSEERRDSMSECAGQRDQVGEPGPEGCPSGSRTAKVEHRI